MAGKKFSIEAVFSALDKISAPIAKIKTKLGSLGKGASGALKGANAAVDRGIAGMGKFSDAIGIAGAVSVAGLGLALRDTIDEGANFERTMVFAAAQFPGMIKQGTKEFDALSIAARKVGDETEFSSQDAAEGLTLLATAGLSAKAAIAALPKVVNFATASKVEFARASDIANNTMGAFSLTSKDATKNAANMSRVMDVLTRAAADSTTNVEELFDAVKMGGTVANSAGTSLEQFVGYAEALAGVGIKGGDAGTAIRNMFLELGAPSTSAVKGMNALGVKLAKTKSGAIDMTATVGRFAKATAKMTKAQKIAALGNVFGARTIGPFIALMDAGVGTIDDFKMSLEKAGGTTEGMAKLLSADTLGALRNFSSLIDGVKLDVFTAIRPVLLDIIKATSEWVTQNRELIKTKAAEWITALRDNLPKIWEWTIKLAKAFAGFLAFAVAIKAINMAILAYEVVAKLATGATWLWNAATDSSILSNVALAGEIVALKVAQLASSVATGALTAATWLYEAAIWAGQVGTAEFTLAAVASKVAQYASSAAAAALTAATWLYEAAQTAVALVTGRVTVATVAGRVAQLASQAATLIATAAQGAYAAVLGVTSGALGVFRAATLATVPAIGAQAAALAPFILTVGAAAAAVLALKAAWDQWGALDKSLSGSGGIGGTIDQMRAMGTFDPFKAHDAAMNASARDARLKQDLAERDAPQIVTPQARAASEAAEANASASVSGEITVKAAPGVKATAQSKASSVPLRVQQSGAF
jgi:TP901 family phage tail tape measure protein